METIAIATFHDRLPAEDLRKRFESAGITAEVSHESVLDWLWFSRRQIVKYLLKVSKQDFETALRLLYRWDAENGVLKAAIRCPSCGSSRVEYPQFTRKFLLPNLIGLVAALGIVQRKFYCEDCHYTWGGRRRPKQAKHGAPYYFIEDVEARAAAPTPQPAVNAGNKAGHWQKWKVAFRRKVHHG